MILNYLSMNGYGVYVWSSFIFTFICFIGLYFIIKLQLKKEQDKFKVKYFDLTKEEGLALYNQGLKGARETLARIGVSILDSLNLRFALNGSDEDIVSLPIQPSL